jgi:peroxiredoxin
MAQLRQDYQKFVERDTEVIAVGPEDAESFTAWWHQHDMPFPGIPDPKHVIAEGLYRQQSKLFKGGRMPALAVIDRDARIRFMHYADSMSDIPSDREVLAMLDAINRETADRTG